MHQMHGINLCFDHGTENCNPQFSSLKFFLSKVMTMKDRCQKKYEGCDKVHPYNLIPSIGSERSLTVCITTRVDPLNHQYGYL